MKTRIVDVAIIGAGTAGMGAYRTASEYTDSIALIEGGPYGTTCARVGCMPSKLLISAAEAAHHVRHTEVFGIASSEPAIDGAKVLQRVRDERDRFVSFVEESVDGFDPAHKVRGFAQFLDDHTLLVGDDLKIEANRIVIATGSRPIYPPLLNEAGDRLLVNDDVFELNTVPESVVVFGPGIIGLELGQALSRLGSRIKMFGARGGLGSIKDPEIRQYAISAFNDEFYLDPGAEVVNVGNTGKGVRVSFVDKQGNGQSEEFDYLLAATGRRPNVDQLGIENTSLELDERGVPVFDRYTMQANPGHIFVAGDASNDMPLLHEAADEGRIAGDNAGRFPDVRAGLRRTPLGIVFTDPQIATVGLNLHQVEARCQDCYASGEVSFEDQGRSRVMGVNKGMLKVYAEQGTGLFLGAEMFGPRAEHIAHLLSWAAQQRLTVSEMLDMPFYHPVVEEGVRTALRVLNRNLHIGPEVVARCMDCGPGA